MEGYVMGRIPSDEDFRRAHARMEEIDRNIDRVNEYSSQYFKEICPLRSFKFMLVAEDDKRFRAYLFYKSDKDVESYRSSDVASKMQDFVYAELERQGRGTKGDLAVEFEIDSDENVRMNYEGDYMLRLR